MSTLFDRRSSGILLHPTCLPGPHGIGDLGSAAYRFADYLMRAGQSWWQMLPVGPPGAGNSPYDSPSSFAGSALLVSLELLVEDGLLRGDEVTPPAALGATDHADHAGARAFKAPLLRLAAERMRQGDFAKLREELEAFQASHSDWLPDYVLFRALKEAHGQKPWFEWPAELRLRDSEALARARRELQTEIDVHVFVQFAFARQWERLRQYCRGAGISLLGDLPIYVAYDGADVWAHPDLFFLDEHGRRTVVAGVPPDAFSSTGQRWGNPLYRWDVMQERDFAWWVDRFAHTLERFDAVRIDHFIGLRRYWEVPADHETALHGSFRHAPGEQLLERLRTRLGSLPFIAEDLGLVTDEVHALRNHFELPGMKVLQFAFSDPSGSDYLPHRYERRAVVYSGTHDNDTTVGWFQKLGSADDERRRLLLYVGGDGTAIHWDVIRAALFSVANTALFPLQDLLGLGSASRMNVPGTSEGNWRWRLAPELLTDENAEKMFALCRLADRTPRF